MNKEEKRIAIAEHSSWNYGERNGRGYWDEGDVGGKRAWDVDQLPDYLNDMNAMKKAWDTLSDDQKITFAKKLGNNPKFCQLRKTHVVTRLHLLLGANAEDYADAFLLTHGLTL